MMNGNGVSSALEDIVNDLHGIKSQLREVREAQAEMSRAVAEIKHVTRPSRWGVFLGAMLATACSIGVNQCGIPGVSGVQGVGK